MSRTEQLNMEQDAELSFIPDFQSTVFTVTGPAPDLVAMADEIKALEAAPAVRTHNVAATAVKATVGLENGSQDVLPAYQPATLRTKVRDWLSDRQWQKVDRELGTDIVAERRAQRMAQRILVARIAAGVEQPPVWGKHKAALKLAERAIRE